MPARRAVVVGAGLGGLRAAESLRAQGLDGGITILGDESWMPYNRPPLSKEALAEGITHEALAFPVKSTATGLEWRLGERVVSSDLASRSVSLASGEDVDFDLLVAATGVSARRLPVASSPPTARAGRYVVRSLDDAAALRAALTPGARVVVVGAGFIGCEVVATAVARGCEVHCVAIDVVPMQRPLGLELGAELRRRHEDHGVTFHLGVGVAELRGDARVHEVLLDDGTSLPCEVVVEALGSRCNVDWLEGNGLDLSDGVLCDAALRPLRDGVAIDGVAVVGDIARFPNVRFDERAFRVEHWNIPTESARRAATVLAAWGAGTAYDEVVATEWTPMPAFWSDQYDLRLQSFGMPGLADSDGVRVLEGDLAHECVVGYHRGDDLLGVVAIGMLRAVMAYRDRLGRDR